MKNSFDYTINKANTFSKTISTYFRHQTIFKSKLILAYEWKLLITK